MTNAKCSVDGCKKDSRSNGKCHKHYLREWYGKNSQRVLAQRRQHHKERFAIDPIYRERIRKVKREYERTPQAHARKKERESRRSQNDPRFIAGRILSDSKVNSKRNGNFPLSYTREALIALLTPLKAKCGICYENGIHPLAPSSGVRRLSIDHDHSREQDNFRGLLCYRCNIGLGHLGDSVEGVKRALAYLKRQ